MMKVKDILEWFEGVDPEKEIECFLFEEGMSESGYFERFTRLSLEDKEDDNKFSLIFSFYYPV